MKNKSIAAWVVINPFTEEPMMNFVSRARGFAITRAANHYGCTVPEFKRMGYKERKAVVRFA